MVRRGSQLLVCAGRCFGMVNRQARRAVLSVGVACAVTVLVAAGGGRAASCIVDCGPPTVSAPTATVSSAQTATLRASVDTHGSDTEYRFFVSPTTDQDLAQASPWSMLPGGVGSDEVSWSASGLVPNTSYEAYLDASNADGDSGAGRYGYFQTPLLPAQPVRLSATRRWTTLDGTPTLTAEVGRSDECAEIDLQYRDAFGRWPTTSIATASQNGRASLSTAGLVLDHNTLFRARLPGNGGCYGPNEDYDADQVRQASMSPPLLLYVLPKLSVSLLGPGKRPVGPPNPAEPPIPPGQVEAQFVLYAYQLPAGFRGPVGYLYVKHGRSFSLIARHRIHSRRFFFYDPGLDTKHGVFLICIRARLVADMGPAFRFAACGRHTLMAGGPLGAEFIVRNNDYYPTSP